MNIRMGISMTEKYKNEVEILFSANNIVQEKSELFYDFLSSLVKLIDETYLGEDLIDNEIDAKNHFKWCYDRVSKNFEKERIFFKENGNQYTYLWFFFYGTYYFSDINEKLPKLQSYFDYLFDYSTEKSINELKSFIDLYKIFDQNLNK
jgi:hypothetical protein